jgi:serine/threonine protein kinase
MIGHYRITAKLGQGGMGEVWRAVDTKLDREVAVKILPAALARDPERLARFEREAKILASLNHPNIAQIYGVEDCALVLELVSGETLSGPIPIETAIDYARQIAGALEAAHERSIVHRDLKPSNIMVASDGTIKVLDFGLAKFGNEMPASDASNSPTVTLNETREGVILGTAAYMSPEQVHGKPVDRRSDIFSFGAVLYYMLTGKPSFTGESTPAILASLLKEEPDWDALPAATPSGVRRLLCQCLRKDRKQRLQAIGDARIALEDTDDVAFTAADTASRPTRRRWLVPALVSVLVLLVALSAALYLTRPARFDLSAYKFTPVATDAEPEDLNSWSPDGKSIAYLKNVDGRDQVMVQNLNSPPPTQLTRLPSGVYSSAPFFSRDGQQIYFIANKGVDSALWAVAVVGGDPREVLSFQSPALLAATLSPDGKTLAFWGVYVEGGKRYRSLFISSPPGAPPRKYQPAPFRSEGAMIPNYLRFSPDGSQIVLSARPAPGEGWMWSVPWPDGPNVRPRRIFAGDFPGSAVDFSWMPDSRHICLSDKGNLYLADTRPGNIQQITASAIAGADHPSVSPDGKRILFTVGVEDYDIVEVPLDGSAPRPLVATARSEKSPFWSGAGDQMAFITNRSGESEIWLRSSDGHWERPIVRQSDFSDDPQRVFQSVALSPDGTRVAYVRSGRLWVSPVSGGKASEAVAGGKAEFGGPSWSPDGSSLAYMAIAGGAYHLAVARVGSREPVFFVPGMPPQCRSAPVWSPDGRWIACGGAGETVLLVSPDGAQRRSLPSPVSPSYDRFVLVWSRDAATIYVASSRAERSRLDAIEVRSGNIRRIAEYARDVIFSNGNAYTLGGSLSRDEKSFATTVFNRRADLWMLEGFPQPRRPLY